MPGRCRGCNNILWRETVYRGGSRGICKHCQKIEVTENRRLKHEYYAARNWYHA